MKQTCQEMFPKLEDMLIYCNQIARKFINNEICQTCNDAFGSIRCFEDVHEMICGKCALDRVFTN
jgi:hypothetical protein